VETFSLATYILSRRLALDDRGTNDASSWAGSRAQQLLSTLARSGWYIHTPSIPRRYWAGPQ